MTSTEILKHLDEKVVRLRSDIGKYEVSMREHGTNEWAQYGNEMRLQDLAHTLATIELYRGPRQLLE